MFPRLLVAFICGAALLTGLGGTVRAASPADAAQTPPPDPSDPVVVVENFLAARNARDPFGATAFCASLLPIDDASGEWVADPAATTDWLRQLTDTYVIDTLVRPRAEGQRVAWVERLTVRSLPFREALASSIRVDVEVVVQDGKIVGYNATYPPAPPTGHPEEPQAAAERRAADPGSPSPWLFFGATWVGLAAGLALVTRARRSERVCRSSHEVH